MSHLHSDECQPPCEDYRCEHLICEHNHGTSGCVRCNCPSHLAATDCRRCRGTGDDPVHTLNGNVEPCYACKGTGLDVSVVIP